MENSKEKNEESKLIKKKSFYQIICNLLCFKLINNKSEQESEINMNVIKKHNINDNPIIYTNENICEIKDIEKTINCSIDNNIEDDYIDCSIDNIENDYEICT